MKKLWKKAVAVVLTMTMTVGLLIGQRTKVVKGASWTALTDEDIQNLYSESDFTRQSVHDPSITKDSDGTYYVYGSHMGAAKTKDLMNWSEVSGVSETTDSKLYGAVNSSGNVVTASYETAFTQNQVVGSTTLYKADGNTYSVDFGTYNMNTWIADNSIKGNQWAPDIIYNKEMKKWCMYQSLNGDNWNSAVVLLTSDDIEGPYVYQGPIVFSGFQTANNATGRTYANTDLEIALSQQGETITSLPERYNHSDWGTYWPHAIDPCVFYDEDGKLWLSYGSWSGGIYALELDEKTGLRDYSVNYGSDYSSKKAAVTKDPYFGKKIAGGCYVSGEGSYIEHIGDYYFLFISYGFYSPTGGYNMRIFRSENPDGPYVDPNGKSAIYTSWVDNYRAASRGLQLMGNYQWSTMDVAEIAQGHNSALEDSDGNAYVIYHTKFADGTAGHQLRVHQLYTNEDGWIVAAPYEYAGETVNDSTIKAIAVDKSDIVGDYDFILHEYNNSKAKDDGTVEDNVTIADTKSLTLNEDGTITGDVTGTWKQSAGTSYTTLIISGVTYKGVFTEQTIDGTKKKTMCFSAVANNGVCVWGSHVISDDATAIAKNVLNLEINIPSRVYFDLNLPTDSTDGVTVTWSSSNSQLVAADGTVNSPDTDTLVTLTARWEKGTYYYEKEYELTVVGGGVDDADINTGLEASYQFEDNLVNAVDNSQIGVAKAQSEGKSPAFETNSVLGGKALHQYFGYNDASSISYTQFTNPLKGMNLGGATVSLWINREDTDVWDAIWSFLDEDNEDSYSGRLFMTPNAYLGYNGTGGWFDVNHPGVVTTNCISTKEWHLLTTTVDESNYAIYIDGVKVYDKDNYKAYNADDGKGYSFFASNLLKVISSANHFYLGYGSFWGSAPLLMDKLKIYSRALSEADVAKLYVEDYYGYADSYTIGDMDVDAVDSRQISGDFDVTYKYHMQGTNTGIGYDGWVAEFVDSDYGTEGGCYDVRVDGYGWIYDYGQNKTVYDTNTAVSPIQTSAIYKKKDNTTYTLDNYISAVDSGIDITVWIRRINDRLVIISDSEYVTFYTVITNVKAENLKVMMGGLSTIISDVSCQKADNVDTSIEMDGVVFALEKRVESGDFDSTFSMNSVTLDSVSAPYDSPLLQISDGSKDYEFRTDNYWWQGNNNGSGTSTYDVSVDKLKAGIDLKINVVRKANDITVSFVSDKLGGSVKYQITDNSLGNTLAVSLGGESVILSDISYSDELKLLSTYRSGSVKNAPTREGKAFAGWFHDSEFTSAVGTNQVTGFAYAKFVDEGLLQTKAQTCRVATNTVSTYNNSITFIEDTYKLRLLVGVDGTDYEKVGFIVNYEKDGDSKTKDLNSTTVYSKVDAEGKMFSANDIFGTEAKYIMPALVFNIGDAYIEENKVSFQITPYWITLDGTTVTGEERTITGNQILANTTNSKF